MTTAELLETRANLATEIRALADRQKAWTAEDQTAWDKLNASYDETVEAIKRQDRAAAVAEESLKPAYDRRIGRDGAGLLGEGPMGESPRNCLAWANDSRGGRVPLLGPQHSFAAAVRDPLDMDEGPLSLGRFIHATASGRPEHARREIAALMSTGAGTTGGYLIPVGMSSRIIDLARNKSAVIGAGATTIPMETGELRIVRATGDPTAQWRHPGATITASDPTFDMIVLRARTLACIVSLPIELAEDAVGVAGVVENGIAQAIALEVDRVALRGGNAGNTAEPIGIANTTGINTTALAGSVPTYDELLDGLTPIETANGSPNGWVVHPSLHGSIRKLKDGTGNYLQDHPAIAPLNRRVTKQQLATKITIGDFSQLVIGVRTGLGLEFFRAGSVGGRDAVEDMLIHVRAYVRLDVHLLRPTHFNVLTTA